MIVSIDGPAGAGKSTVAKRLARELGLVYLDTGAMYRAVTLVAMRLGVDLGSEEACARIAEGVELTFDAEGRILVDGEPGEPEIRGEAVTREVSRVSAHPRVRRAVVAMQRRLGARSPGLVAEGRDTTTVVFPDADHKFFLIASPRERARRRAAQLGQEDRVDGVLEEIRRRDHLDSTRADSPLQRAEGAVEVDTEGLGEREVVERMLDVIRARETAP